ncbi:MAG: PQQ-dependent sugar dehydrogenase [Verrucomicrobiota bacterium]
MNTNFIRCILLAFSIGTLAHLPIQAQTITISNSAPSANVYLAHTTDNGAGYPISRRTDNPINNWDSRVWAWTFATSTPLKLSEVVLRYETDRSAAADANRSNLLLALIKDSAESMPSDGDLVFQLEFDSTNAFGAGQYLYFDLGGDYNLDANSSYHFEIWFADANGGTSNELYFARDQEFSENIGDGIELYLRQGNLNFDNNEFPVGSELVAEGNNFDARNPLFYLIENPQIDIEVGVGQSFSLPVVPFGESVPDRLTVKSATDGTTSISTNGRQVVYEHTGSSTGTDGFEYDYRQESSGTTLTRTVNVTISDAFRLPNVSSTVPDRAPTNAIELVPAFDNMSFSQPTKIASAPGDNQRLWVTSKRGWIYLIPDVSADSPVQTAFMNLPNKISSSGRTIRTAGELGLLGLAFHPDYLNNGCFYTVYDARVNGVLYQFVSRWTDPDPLDNDGEDATEELLIQQLNDASNHNGGDIEFGPDGYLYISWGDEGNQIDSLANSQFIDKDFWSSIIRIDVDLEPEDYTDDDGTGSDDNNVAPNSHPAVVLHDGFPLYEVPENNHWVGATSFNGVSVDPSDVRTEFFAVGFRNPWRFDFDPQTDELWVGDVGQNLREEVAIVKSGSNHGWAWREGTVAATSARSGEEINGADESAATLTEPEWDYTRGSNTFQGWSVTGGVVYYGDISDLNGRYIFSDYGSGNVWSLQRTITPGSPIVERIAGLSGIVDFGYDPATGDVIAVNINDGGLYRLTSQTPEEDFPTTLAATGLFADVATLTPNPGIVPYEVNLPFWSDHAIKSRWFMIPNTQDQFGFDPNKTWALPEGTVFIKHFDMLADTSDPNSAFKLETRLIVKNDSGVYGVTYEWNDTETEATLVSEAGKDITYSVMDGGQVEIRKWRFPSRAECLTCHTDHAGGSLSFNTRQLNIAHPHLANNPNFLALMRDAGYLDDLPSQPEDFPRHVRPDENSYSLEARVRSYFAVNCAYCHQPGGGAGNSWDGRPQLTLAETGLIRGMLNRGMDPDDWLIVPGDALHSAILSRISETNGYTRMPPLATFELDQVGIDLVTDWLENELQSTVTYTEWRIANFGDDTSPEGEMAANPDGDRNDNKSEWLQNTDPNRADQWNYQLVLDNESIGIEFEGLGNRQTLIEHSTNLIDWERWDVPNNDGLPKNPNQMHHFTGDLDGDRSFLRITIEEN